MDGWWEWKEDRIEEYSSVPKVVDGPVAPEVLLWTHPQAVRDCCLLSSLYLSRFYCGTSYGIPLSQIPRLAPCMVHDNHKSKLSFSEGSTGTDKLVTWSVPSSHRAMTHSPDWLFLDTDPLWTRSEYIGSLKLGRVGSQTQLCFSHSLLLFSMWLSSGSQATKGIDWASTVHQTLGIYHI